jgi:hypothetical protein
MHFPHYRLAIQPNKINGRDNHLYQTLRFAEFLRKIFMGIEGRCNDGQLTPVFAAWDAEGNYDGKKMNSLSLKSQLLEKKNKYSNKFHCVTSLKSSSVTKIYR